MRTMKILSAIMATIMLLLILCAKTEAFDFAEGLDWKNRVITVTGESVVPPDSINYTQAKGLVSRGAKADAYRKLGEFINGVCVEAETTVEKLTTQKNIKMRVDTTIRGAKIIDENFRNDGIYRVTVQVPLFGVSNSLAGALFEKNSYVEPFPKPDSNVAPSVQNYNSSTPIKQRLEQSHSVLPYQSPLARKTVSTLRLTNLQNAQHMPKKTVSEYASMAQGNYTGLIVDCRGLGKLNPVMSPVIKNSNGTTIYGHKNIDVDKIISLGLVDYVTDIEKVERAGSNPLVVKAISLENFNSNPVVAIPDSNRILIENHATKFLKDLKVVFLFD